MVYNCRPLLGGLVRTESLWLLTRAQQPDPDLVASVYTSMRERGLPVDSLRQTVQTQCQLLPSLQAQTIAV